MSTSAPPSTQQKGKAAEAFAKQYLQQQGLKLLEENYRCRFGEIDLIMQDKSTTVFVEVRYRKSQRFGSGAETVDYQKQRKLIATASHYLQAHANAVNRACRFDVISLTMSPKTEKQEFAVLWIPHAIET